MSTKDWIEKDYYAILGVPKDAAADEVKKAYRRLARENHPDRNTGDSAAEERFKAVSEAYDVLSDADKRKQYDEARSLFGAGGSRVFGRPNAGGGGFSFDLGDLFAGGASGPGGASGGFGDVLGGLFNQRPRTGGPRRGADLESEVRIGFREAVDGVTVPLRMTSAAACTTCAGTGAKAGTMPRVCPACDGTGHTSQAAGGFAVTEPCRQCRGRGLVVDDPCEVCHGSGRGTTTRSMNVRIPGGVQDGQRIRLAGKGAPGERGGRAGDLYVSVHVTPHRVFGRRGDHLTLSVPVTFPEATLGAEVPVPTLDGGQVTLKVPPGTPNGRTFRIRGKGARRSDGTRGDLLVSVAVAVPQRVEGPAREALRAYQEASAPDDPRAELIEAAAS